MNDHDKAQLFDGREETDHDYRQYLLDTNCDAAQAALHAWAGVTVDTRLIAHAIADEPALLLAAAEHGWDDGEAMDKLWAILCTKLLDITYSEQTARFFTEPHSLAGDVAAVHARWVADNPPAGR